MKQSKKYSANPIEILKSFIFNLQLIWQMTKREVIGRYRGSFMGLAWSFFNPLLMLIVYTFVFSFVFKARWGIDGNQSKTQFATVLFVGLIIHGLFSEVANRAPVMIMSNVNYVKKVLFPLEILPVVSMGTALFHSFVSVIVLLLALITFNGHLHWTIIFLPAVIFPLIIATLGIAWFLSSLGVFLRDVGQAIGIITTILLFVSPVFYPISALPKAYQWWLLANPLTFIIEQSRNVIIWGVMPNWGGLAIYYGSSFFIAWIGFAWFQKTRKGFADVL